MQIQENAGERRACVCAGVPEIESRTGPEGVSCSKLIPKEKMVPPPGRSRESMTGAVDFRARPATRSKRRSWQAGAHFESVDEARG